MSPVCAPAGSGESSSFGPCLAVASPEPDVTAGSGQDFSQNTSVLRTQPHGSPSQAPQLTPSSSASPNLSAPGLPPQFKLDEFSTNILNFQKQPENLCDPVRADLHPLS